MRIDPGRRAPRADAARRAEGLAALLTPTDGLILATKVIAYLALLGLKSTLVRYLPTAQNRDELITASFLSYGSCSS